MTDARVTVDVEGHVLLIGLNRPDKRNAADFHLLTELAEAYGRLEREAGLRCAVVYAHGDHFTAGLDLADVAPRIGPGGLDAVPEGGIDPWQMSGRVRTKPVVIAVQGICLTLGVELILAGDVAIADETASFAQLEVSRGILPFGGATLRFPRIAGWGNAMRWILTGERFDAAEALRLGLVQEVVPAGEQFVRAKALANRIAAQAPLAVQAALANARLAQAEGDVTAAAALGPELARLAASEDAQLGMEAFLSRTNARFTGS